MDPAQFTEKVLGELGTCVSFFTLSFRPEQSGVEKSLQRWSENIFVQCSNSV